MTRTLDGIFAVVLVIWTALWVAFWTALGWSLRAVYRWRHRIPYAHLVLPALAVYAPLTLAFGPVRAALVVAVPGAWLIGAPLLEDLAAERGKQLPRPLVFAAAEARDAVLDLEALHVRGVWRAAIRDLDLPRIRVTKTTRTPAGWTLRLKFKKGWHAGCLVKLTGNLASSFGARTVTVLGSSDNARTGVAYITLSDPLGANKGQEIPWPWIDAESITMWQPLPLGSDQHGHPVTLELFNEGHGAHSCLVGGLPGGGKSALINLLTSACAKDPSAELFVCDGKPPALRFWRDRSSVFVGNTSESDTDATKSAIAALEQAHEWMKRSYARLESEDRDTARPGDPIAVVIVDELSTFLTGAKTDPVAKILTGLVKRGRAAGLAVVVATQKCTVDAVPTQVRSNVDYRVAFRVKDLDSSKAILGTTEPDASKLPEQAGRGYIDTGPRTVEFCAYYVSGKDARKVAARTVEHSTVGTTPTTQGEAIRSAGASPDVPVTPVVPAVHDASQGSPVASESVGSSDRSEETPMGAPAGSEVPSTPGRVVPGQAVASNGAVEPGRRHLRVVPDEKSNPRAVLQFKVELELRDHWDDSNVAISKRVGCSDKTVAAARRRLERTG